MAYYREEVTLELEFQRFQIKDSSASNIVVAIDFGTTYTGVAFAQSENLKSEDVMTLVNNVGVITNWPGQVGSYTEKTPTVIAYNKNPPVWGGSVHPYNKPQVSYFKLGLQPPPPNYYRLIGGQSSLPFLEPNWRHPDLPNKSAKDYAADYLKCITTYIREQFFPRQFGAAFLRGQSISYVITVPAIWEDSAKNLTRQAAERAGIPPDSLKLITEPEAAALYCASLCHQVDLHDRDRFLVTDAGGGTVDLIAYQVVSREPFEVKECYTGSGGTCGAVFLHRGFEKLLRDKLRNHANSILTKERLDEALDWFERYVKRVFNPYDDSDDVADYRVPMHNTPNIREIGLLGGYLKLSTYNDPDFEFFPNGNRNEVDSVFKKVFGQIETLVRDQIEGVERESGPLKTMFLVGGFGSNQYLYSYLDDKFGGRLKIQQPALGHTAIMKGAVLYRLGMNWIKERKMRRNYGIEISTDFTPGVHPESSRYTDASGRDLTRVGLEWVAYKDRRMATGHVVRLQNYGRNFTPQEYNSAVIPKVTLRMMICKDNNPPSFTNQSVSKLCDLYVDLSPLKPFEMNHGTNGLYYRANFDIVVNFGPEIVYGLMKDGRILGSISADYVE